MKRLGQWLCIIYLGILAFMISVIVTDKFLSIVLK